MASKPSCASRWMCWACGAHGGPAGKTLPRAERIGGKMKKPAYLNSAAAGIVLGFAATAASAAQFDIPAGTLEGALTAYMRQTGVQLMVSEDAVKGARTRGVRGDLTSDEALN